GIGVNTALFSVVNGLLLRALPVRAPQQLVMLSTRHSIDEGYPAGWNYAIWDQIRHRADNFDGAVAWTVFTQRLDLAQGGERQPADGLFVRLNFFSALGIPLLTGRGFTAAGDALGSADSRVAVLSYGFWQRHFGGTADVVGKALSVNRTPVTIIGVAPPGFLGSEGGSLVGGRVSDRGRAALPDRAGMGRTGRTVVSRGDATAASRPIDGIRFDDVARNAATDHRSRDASERNLGRGSGSDAQRPVFSDAGVGRY